MYDSHIHSHHSRDSKTSIDTICQKAIARGLKSVCITDHVNIMAWSGKDGCTQRIIDCINEVNAAKEKYKGILEVRIGMEIGEYLYDVALSKEFLSLGEFDFILGSLHSIRFMDYKGSFLETLSTPDYPIEHLEPMLKIYYSDLLETVRLANIDAIAHLTYPVRYMHRLLGISVLPQWTDEYIEEIFKTAISRGIAIEVNTASIGKDTGEFVPNERLLKRYKELGGYLVTIGSDAHTEDRVGFAISEAKEMLKSLGFENYYYYDKRKPKAVKI